MMDTPTIHQTRSTITPPKIQPWIVFLLCCAFYIVTASGHTYSPDEETMIAVADAIVHSHSVALRHADGQPWAALRDGINYGRYASYGILPSLLVIPAGVTASLFYDPSSLAYTDLLRLLVGLINAPITAATIVCLAVLLNRTTLSRSAHIATLICTTAGACLWPYARSFFSEPLTMLLITASLTSATRKPTTNSTIWLAACCAGLLLPTRIAAVVAIPILAAVALWRTPLRIGIIVSGLLGIIPGVLLWGGYNILRFGTFFATGYGTESTAFDTPFLTGLSGLLFSAGSGIVWYAPFIVWIPFGVRYWWQHNRPVLVASLALCLSHLLLYASWSAWDGGGVWGPRFLVPIIPAALLIAAGVWQQPHRLWRYAAGATVVIGVFITTLGSAVNFSLDSNLPLPRPIPPVAHARLLWNRLQTTYAPNQSCRIESHWYPSEASDGILWQRSNGESTFSCRLTPQTILRLRLDDRRPPNAPASDLALVTADTAYPLPAGTFRVVQILSRAGTQRFRLTSTPWNPAILGISDRADDLGPTLLALSAVPPLATIQDASIAPMPSQPMRRWAWYYEPTNRHLGDWWVWYLPYTALAPSAGWLIAIWCLLWGSCLVASIICWRRSCA